MGWLRDVQVSQSLLLIVLPELSHSVTERCNLGWVRVKFQILGNLGWHQQVSQQIQQPCGALGLLLSGQGVRGDTWTALTVGWSDQSGFVPLLCRRTPSVLFLKAIYYVNSWCRILLCSLSSTQRCIFLWTKNYFSWTKNQFFLKKNIFQLKTKITKTSEIPLFLSLLTNHHHR